MFYKRRFYLEVAIKQVILLVIVIPVLLLNTFDSMYYMDKANQSSILTVVGLLMAAGIIGVFEASYQKTDLKKPAQRWFAHITKFLLFMGVTELMILAIAVIGTTYTFWEDPLLWALLPVYIALYVYDWWDALIAS